MPFDVSGNFSRSHNWQEDRDNGIRILADRHDEEDDNFAGGFNLTFLRTGTVPMTGNLQMGGNAIRTIGTGSDAAPSMTWELSNSTGFSQPSPNAIAFSAGGVRKLLFNDVGLTVAGDAAFTGNLTITGNIDSGSIAAKDVISVTGAIPGFQITESDAGVNLKKWDILANVGGLYFRATTDDYTTGNAFMYVSRNGALPDAVELWTTGYNRFRIDAVGNTNVYGHFTSTGNVTSGGNGSFKYDLTVERTTYFGTSGKFFSYMAGGGPVTSFDDGDYMAYDSANNNWYISIANSAKLILGPVENHLAQNTRLTGSLNASGQVAGQTIITQEAGMGTARLQNGGTLNSGYVAFHHSNGGRLGYVGFVPMSGGGIQYVAENGAWGHAFNSPVSVIGDINTNLAVHAHTYYLDGGGYFHSLGANQVELNMTGGITITNINDGYLRLWGGSLLFIANSVTRVYISANEQWFNTTTFPNSNNAFQMGGTSYAWYNVSSYNYATPSDAREKVWRGEANLKEIKAARRIVDELGFYKWNHGPAQDKWQFGLRAQSLASILMQEGVETTHNLDFDHTKFIPDGERPTFKYGLIDFDSWEDRYMPMAGDQDTNTVGPPELVQTAGNRFAVKNDQLALFLLSATAKHVKALEQRIEDLEAVVQP